jgi:hypothetical protein
VNNQHRVLEDKSCCHKTIPSGVLKVEAGADEILTDRWLFPTYGNFPE